MLPVLPMTNTKVQSSFAKATEDRTEDELELGNIGIGNISTF